MFQVSKMVQNSNQTDRLNVDGVFLQKFCVEEIYKVGWKVEEEFPVTLGFSTGAKNEIYESTGDIRATLQPKQSADDYQLRAIVECKHRFEPHWIFFESFSASRSTPKLLDVQYAPERNLTERASKYIATFYYTDLKLQEIDNCLLCNIGKEHPDFIKRKNKKHDSIYEACREVSLATKSSAEEDRHELENYGEWMENPTHSIYIPIVVTSATIEICKYDLQNFAKEKVIKNASFSQVGFLAYDFPLPSYLRTTYKMRHPFDFNEMNKQTIFIVNFLNCTKFFQLLESYFEKWSNEILHEPDLH